MDPFLTTVLTKIKEKEQLGDREGLQAEAREQEAERLGPEMQICTSQLHLLS